MSAQQRPIKIRKPIPCVDTQDVVHAGNVCGTISGEDMSRVLEFQKSRRHALKIELAALDKLLGFQHKCRHCGNAA